MIAVIDIRNLKACAAEIVRRVKNTGNHFLVIHCGRPAAILQPNAPGAVEPSGCAAWDEMAQKGEKIRRGWQSVITSTEILSEMRR
jgi:antitoxin (DNA-binding transcriptional repressor) of toxin-antitoxin stability system